MKLPLDFRDLLEEFAREGVEFVVIGAYAFGFHVAPRATKDLDLLLEGSPENLARAARALGRYGAPSDVVEAVRNLGEDEVAYVGQPPLRIDFLRSIDGVSPADVFAHSVRGTWEELPVRVISLDDLVRNKRAAARPQDLVDVRKLEKVRERKG
jgi:hypothetical protein